jgi:hypothetical protein
MQTVDPSEARETLPNFNWIGAAVRPARDANVLVRQ